VFFWIFLGFFIFNFQLLKGILVYTVPNFSPGVATEHTQVSCIILNNFIMRLRRELAGKFSLLTPLPTFSPTRLLFFFAFVRNLSYVLCNLTISYKFTEISLICICYRDSFRFAPVRRLQTAGTHRGVHRDSVKEAL